MRILELPQELTEGKLCQLTWKEDRHIVEKSNPRRRDQLDNIWGRSLSATHFLPPWVYGLRWGMALQRCLSYSSFIYMWASLFPPFRWKLWTLKSFSLLPLTAGVSMLQPAQDKMQDKLGAEVSGEEIRMGMLVLCHGRGVLMETSFWPFPPRQSTFISAKNITLR